MTRQRTSHTIASLLSHVCFLVVPCILSAQGFYDDFEDGSATDGTPVAWQPLPNAASGLRYVTDGNYIIEPQSSDLNVISSSYVPDRIFDDASLRSQVRWQSPTSSYSGVGLIARLTPSVTAWNGYIGGIGTDGLLFITELVDGDEQLRISQNSSLNPVVGDVYLQFDVIGTSLSLFAWQDGTEKPLQPQLQYFDTTNTSGMAGFGMRPSTNMVPVALRYFAAVPEPSSSILCLFGLLGLLPCRRRT